MEQKISFDDVLVSLCAIEGIPNLSYDKIDTKEAKNLFTVTEETG